MLFHRHIFYDDHSNMYVYVHMYILVSKYSSLARNKKEYFAHRDIDEQENGVVIIRLLSC